MFPIDGSFYNTDQTLIYSASDNLTFPVVLGPPSGTVYCEGLWAVSLTATDEAGNSSQQTVAFVVDKTPPQIVIMGVENGAIYNTDKAATVSAIDRHLKTQIVLLDGTAYASGTLIKVEGSHTLMAFAEDLAGNTTSMTISFMIDKTPPTIVLNSPTRDYTMAENVTIDYFCFDKISGISSVVATWDGRPIGNLTTIDLFYSSLGTHTLVINAADLAGNLSTYTYTFNVIATLKSLEQLVDRCFAERLIDNRGVYTSLKGMLKTAEAQLRTNKIEAARKTVQAFINQVEAQSGKHIDAWAADLLIRNAFWVLNHL